MKVYTKKGDDGTTGLLYGGRVPKDSTGPTAYGSTDEAVAALGSARALAGDRPIGAVLLRLQRELFIVGAELATAVENRHKLTPGVTRLEPTMVTDLEAAIDEIEERRGMPTEFVVPGENPLAAAIDVARTVVRRAEREAVTHVRSVGLSDSLVVPYLNRLADYLWMAARDHETEWTSSKAD